MDNLVKQLRDYLNKCREAGLPKPPLLEEAADTIAAQTQRIEKLSGSLEEWRLDFQELDKVRLAQARLLELAGTMAGAANNINHWHDAMGGEGMVVSAEHVRELWTVRAAFIAAQAEYQTTGKVPCGECERISALSAELGHEIVKLCDERDEARRQLGEAQEANRLHEYRASVLQAERDALASNIAHIDDIAANADRFARKGRTATDRLSGIRAVAQNALDNLSHHAEQVRLERAVVEVLREIIENCPYGLDSASVPRGGVDVNPSQVVGTMSVALVRYRRATAALAALDAHDRKDGE